MFAFILPQMPSFGSDELKSLNHLGPGATGHEAYSIWQLLDWGIIAVLGLAALVLLFRFVIVCLSKMDTTVGQLDKQNFNERAGHSSERWLRDNGEFRKRRFRDI